MLMESMVFVSADNSGAKLLNCIKINNAKRSRGRLGIFVKVSLKKTKNKKKFKKRSIYNGIPVFIKNSIYRKDGCYIKGSSNKCLLFSDSFKFLATRSKGLIFKEIRNTVLIQKNTPKIVKYQNVIL